LRSSQVLSSGKNTPPQNKRYKSVGNIRPSHDTKFQALNDSTGKIDSFVQLESHESDKPSTSDKRPKRPINTHEINQYEDDFDDDFGYNLEDKQIEFPSNEK